MKKLFLIFIFVLICVPINIHAGEHALPHCPHYDEETKTCNASICKSGCDGEEFDIPSEFYTNDNSRILEVDTLIINLKNEEYDIYSGARFYFDQILNVIINGNGATFISDEDSDAEILLYGHNININDLSIKIPTLLSMDGDISLFGVNIDDSERYIALDIRKANKIAIKNSNIKGISCSFSKSVPIEIDNSNLLGDKCSISVSSYMQHQANKSTINNATFLYEAGTKQESSFLPATPNAGDVIIKNSKLNCACAGAGGGQFNVNIYIDSSNIITDELANRTSVEENHSGHVYIESSNTDDLVVNVDTDVPIDQYFKNIKNIDDVIWEVEDETIAKIEDNKIIPLKAGTTNIYGIENRNYYKLAITVREDVVEPTPTATVTPTVAPTPNGTPTPSKPEKDNSVKVPDTYAFSLIMILFAIILSIFFTYRLIIKEEE